MADSKLRFGPVGSRAWHIVIDMQRMFAEPDAFFCPDLSSIISVVKMLTAHHPENTVFSRYVAPDLAEITGASWQDSYRQWICNTLIPLDKGMFDLIEPLLQFIPPASVVEKNTFSAFESPDFTALLINNNLTP